MEIKEIYSFRVIDELLCGNKVMAVDRLGDEILNLSKFSIFEISEILDNDEKNRDRYLFYYRIQKEASKNV